jgi:hypothetical protein
MADNSDDPVNANFDVIQTMIRMWPDWPRTAALEARSARPSYGASRSLRRRARALPWPL